MSDWHPETQRKFMEAAEKMTKLEALAKRLAELLKDQGAYVDDESLYTAAVEGRVDLVGIVEALERDILTEGEG